MRPADLFIISRNNPRATAVFWTVAGAISVALALWVAMQPGRLLDFWTVREWLLHHAAGDDPYRAFANLDYPPNALLVLAPLGWFSDRTVIALLLVVVLASAAAATLILLQWFAERVGVSLTPRMKIMLVAMMFADAAMRGTIWRGQTAPLSILFGALALRWAAKRPAVAAIALALCAFKPHIAVGFALALLLQAHVGVVLWAGALAVAQIWIFAAGIDRPVFDLLARYAVILNNWYEGPESINGLLSIRWVLTDLLGDYGQPIYIAFALGSLAFLGVRARRSRTPEELAIVTAALLLWSLACLPHQLYHGALTLPALWLLMWPEAGISMSLRVRSVLVGIAIVVSVADIPRGLLWMAERRDDLAWLAYGSYYIRPVRIMALLALLMYGLTVRRQTSTYSAENL